MELTLGRFLRFLVALFFIFIIGWVLYTLSKIITIIIIAALIAYILDPLASYLEAKNLARSNSTMIIFLILFLNSGYQLLLNSEDQQSYGLREGLLIAIIIGFLMFLKTFIITIIGSFMFKKLGQDILLIITRLSDSMKTHEGTSLHESISSE